MDSLVIIVLPLAKLLALVDQIHGALSIIKTVVAAVTLPLTSVLSKHMLLHILVQGHPE
jgi:hypothetical protein